MNVIVFGSTGMVGQGVVRECLLDPEVVRVVTVVRAATGLAHDKLREVVHADLSDLSTIAGELSGLDACFYCLGASSSGLAEDAYRRITVGLTESVCEALIAAGGVRTMVFVSGAGSDNTGKSKVMWSRVKGLAENYVLALPFETKCVFRPALIQPRHGEVSKTSAYRVLYALISPLMPVLRLVAGKHMTTTETVARAMLRVAKNGASQTIFENHEINALVT